MSGGECQTKNVAKEYDEKDEKAIIALDEGDIALLKTYGIGPYTNASHAPSNWDSIGHLK